MDSLNIFIFIIIILSLEFFVLGQNMFNKIDQVPSQTNKWNNDPKLDQITQIRKLYDLSISPSRENDVKIKDIYLYPFRGVRGVKVDHCEITPYGLKRDRLWVIVSKTKNKVLDGCLTEIGTFMRQEFVGEDGLRVYLMDDKCFPNIKKRDHVLNINRDYSNEPVFDNGMVKDVGKLL